MNIVYYKPKFLARFILFYSKHFDNLVTTKGIRWIFEGVLFYVVISLRSFLRLKPLQSGSNNKIHFVIRHLPIKENRNASRHHNQRPKWFSYETCFDSLFKSIEQIPKTNYTIKILYDGNFESLKDDILWKYLETDENIEIILVNGGSEKASGIIMHSYVSSLDIPKEDLIYFVENDYLHSQNWYNELIEFNKKVKDWAFISFFNHPNENPMNLKNIGSIKWGEIYSTTGTYMVKAEIYNTLSLLYFFNGKDYKFFKICCRGLGYKMYTPAPTLAQHAMNIDISKTFDLSYFIQKSS